MQAKQFNLIRYDADDGFVFDWAQPRFITLEHGGELEEVQEHLYVKTLFIGGNDSIDNYIEVEAPKEDA